MPSYASLEFQLSRLVQLLNGDSAAAVGSPEAAEAALSKLADAVAAGSAAGVSTISEVIVGAGGAPNISFSGIPNTYKSLHLEVTARGDYNDIQINLLMRVNGDSGFSYNSQAAAQYAGPGDTLGIIDEASGNSMTLARISANTAPANTFSAVDIRMHNYADTTLFKTFLSVFAYKIGSAASNQASGQGGGTWQSMSAINSILLMPFSGNFVQYTRATLWGIK